MGLRTVTVSVVIILLGFSWLCAGCRRTKDTQARTVGSVAQVSVDEPSKESSSSRKDVSSEPKLVESPALEAPRKAGTLPETPRDGTAKIAENDDSPKFLIDSGDPKYIEGPKPDLPIDGKPVDIIYRPPHMFALNFTKANENDEIRGITFATMTISDEAGTDFEIHLLLRDGAKPIVPIFRLTSSQVKIGETWAKPCGNFTVHVKMLDFSKTLAFPRSTLEWIKVRVQVEK